jgi:TolB-like protein
LPDRPSVAVLPFSNLSQDPAQEYFSDGVTEDLITGLSKVSGLFVIARNSVFTYKGKPVKVREVGRDLGVRYVPTTPTATRRWPRYSAGRGGPRRASGSSVGPCV